MLSSMLIIRRPVTISEYRSICEKEGRKLPYYMRNTEWYTVNEDGRDRLTDKAPKKARDSFILFWGSDDPAKRSKFYFLSNPEWYIVNLDIERIERGKRAFKLTKKAPPEARWSYKLYYQYDYSKKEFGKENGKPYYMTNPHWYTAISYGKVQLTDAAPPEAKASYLEQNSMYNLWRSTICY